MVRVPVFILAFALSSSSALAVTVDGCSAVFGAADGTGMINNLTIHNFHNRWELHLMTGGLMTDDDQLVIEDKKLEIDGVLFQIYFSQSEENLALVTASTSESRQDLSNEFLEALSSGSQLKISGFADEVPEWATYDLTGSREAVDALSLACR